MIMKYFLRYLQLIVSTFLMYNVSVAQSEDSISTHLNKTITVRSEYKPQISDVSRLAIAPRTYDTLDLRVDIHYSIKTEPLQTAYTPRTLKPVNVTGDKLQELYKGYAAIGAGNYAKTFAHLYYTSERSRSHQKGIEFYHNASAGKARFDNDARLPAGYTQDYISAYIKKFTPSYNYFLAIKPQYYSALKYGHPLYDSTIVTVPDTNLAKRNIKRHFFTNRTEAYIESARAQSQTLLYEAGINHAFTCMNPAVFENYALLHAQAKKSVQKITYSALFETEWSGVNFIPIDEVPKNIAHIRLAPELTAVIDNWSLTMGVQAVQSLGLQSLKAYPKVFFKYNFFQHSFVPYISYSGKLRHYSIEEMLTENPYTTDNVLLKPTNYRANIEAGVKGKIVRTMPFALSVSYKKFENLYFWVNDIFTTHGVQNSFVPQYDNGEIIRPQAEIGIDRRKFNASVGAALNHYNLDSLYRPWHRPGIESFANFNYAIVNPETNKTKLILSSKIFYEDQRYAQTLDGGIVKLSSILDANIGIEYFYNSALVIFAHCNNITSHKYEQYYLFPNYRFNFLVGLTYSFSGLKQ